MGLGPDNLSVDMEEVEVVDVEGDEGVAKVEEGQRSV